MPIHLPTKYVCIYVDLYCKQNSKTKLIFSPESVIHTSFPIYVAGVSFLGLIFAIPLYLHHHIQEIYHKSYWLYRHNKSKIHCTILVYITTVSHLDYRLSLLYLPSLATPSLFNFTTMQE